MLSEYILTLPTGEKVGSVGVLPLKGRSLVNRLWVHPDYRGQGLGRRLLGNITDDADKEGVVLESHPWGLQDVDDESKDRALYSGSGNVPRAPRSAIQALHADFGFAPVQSGEGFHRWVRQPVRGDSVPVELPKGDAKLATVNPIKAHLPWADLMGLSPQEASFQRTHPVVRQYILDGMRGNDGVSFDQWNRLNQIHQIQTRVDRLRASQGRRSPYLHPSRPQPYGNPAPSPNNSTVMLPRVAASDGDSSWEEEEPEADLSINIDPEAIDKLHEINRHMERENDQLERERVQDKYDYYGDDWREHGARRDAEEQARAGSAPRSDTDWLLGEGKRLGWNLDSPKDDMYSREGKNGELHVMTWLPNKKVWAGDVVSPGGASLYAKVGDKEFPSALEAHHGMGRDWASYLGTREHFKPPHPDEPARPGGESLEDFPEGTVLLSPHDLGMNLSSDESQAGYGEFHARPYGSGFMKLNSAEPWWKFSAASDLTVEDYEGEEGNRNHITRNETGMVPVSWLLRLKGANGERPGMHRNYSGERWDHFKQQVAAGAPGYSEPIFITVDHNGEPVISEGNHRRDAYWENALAAGVSRHDALAPVNIRYFGHAERQGTLGERYQRMQHEAAWFHGTNHQFGPGDMIETGHPSNYGFDPEDHVYFTSDEGNAYQWAQDAGDMPHDEDWEPDPQVYEVEPTGEYEQDPKAETAVDFRSRHPLRVIRRVAAGGDGFPNPYHSNPEFDGNPDFSHTWFHGTKGGTEFGDRRGHGDFAARLALPPEERIKGSAWPQPNQMMGVHFSPLHEVAHKFAWGSKPSAIVHASLDFDNPAHFPTERHLDYAVADWASKNFPEWHNEKLNRDRAWNYSDQEGTHADFSQVPEGYGNRAQDVLQWHPYLPEIIKGFHQHLADLGHHGITYGNEVEGPYISDIISGGRVRPEGEPYPQANWPWGTPKSISAIAQPRDIQVTNVERVAASQATPAPDEMTWEQAGRLDEPEEVRDRVLAYHRANGGAYPGQSMQHEAAFNSDNEDPETRTPSWNEVGRANAADYEEPLDDWEKEHGPNFAIDDRRVRAFPHGVVPYTYLPGSKGTPEGDKWPEESGRFPTMTDLQTGVVQPMVGIKGTGDPSDVTATRDAAHWPGRPWGPGDDEITDSMTGKPTHEMGFNPFVDEHGHRLDPHIDEEGYEVEPWEAEEYLRNLVHRKTARVRPTWENRQQEPTLHSEFGSVKVPGLLPEHTIHYAEDGQGASCGTRNPEGSSNNVTHVTCNKCKGTMAYRMAPSPRNPNGMTYDEVNRENRLRRRAAVDESGLKAAGIAVIAMDTGRVLMLQRALNPTTCPCGRGVTWDEQNGWQHEDGTDDHDEDEFSGQSVTDLLDQGHDDPERESALAEYDHNEGVWEFPGGTLEPGENPRQAAVREFREEVGQDLPQGVFVGAWLSPGGIVVTAAGHGRAHPGPRPAELLPVEGETPLAAMDRLGQVDPTGWTHGYRKSLYNLYYQHSTSLPNTHPRWNEEHPLLVAGRENNAPDLRTPYQRSQDRMITPLIDRVRDGYDIGPHSQIEASHIANAADPVMDGADPRGLMGDQQYGIDGVCPVPGRGGPQDYQDPAMAPRVAAHIIPPPEDHVDKLLAAGWTQHPESDLNPDFTKTSPTTGVQHQATWDDEQRKWRYNASVFTNRGRRLISPDHPGRTRNGFGSFILDDPEQIAKAEKLFNRDYLLGNEEYGEPGIAHLFNDRSTFRDRWGDEDDEDYEPDTAAVTQRSEPAFERLREGNPLGHFGPEPDQFYGDFRVPAPGEPWVKGEHNTEILDEPAHSNPFWGNKLSAAADISREQWRQLPKVHQDAILATDARDDMAPDLAAQGHDMEWTHGPNWAQKGYVQNWVGNCRNCGASVSVEPTCSSVPNLGRDARTEACAGPGTQWQNDMLIEHRRNKFSPVVENYLQGLKNAEDREWLRGQGFEVEGAVKGPVYKGFIYLVQHERDIDLTQREHSNPDDPDGDMSEQSAWWDIEDAKANPALRPECKQGTPWDELELWADKSVRSNREIVAMVTKLSAQLAEDAPHRRAIKNDPGLSVGKYIDHGGKLYYKKDLLLSPARRAELHGQIPPSWDSPAMREDFQDAKDSADKEYFGSLMRRAIGVNAAHVIRSPRKDDPPHTVYSEVAPNLRSYGDAADTDSGILAGLGDMLQVEGDRRRNNWGTLPNGDPFVYDFAYSDPANFSDKLGPGQNQWGHVYSDFAHHFMDDYVAHRYGRLGENPLSPSDVSRIGEALENLRPEYERAGRGDWHDELMNRWGEIASNAAGDDRAPILGNNVLPHEQVQKIATVRTGMGITPEDANRMAFRGYRDEDKPVYLRFGKWPASEQSMNHITGIPEYGVSVYDLDNRGEPIDPDSAMDRGIHTYDPDECGPMGEYGCEEHNRFDNERDEEFMDDTADMLRGHLADARREHNRGPRRQAELVTGTLEGFGHDDEPLLRNVKRVGHWPCDVHKFIPGMTKTPDGGFSHEGRWENGKVNWCEHPDHDEPMEHEAAFDAQRVMNEYDRALAGDESGLPREPKNLPGKEDRVQPGDSGHWWEYDRKEASSRVAMPTTQDEPVVRRVIKPGGPKTEDETYDEGSRVSDVKLPSGDWIAKSYQHRQMNDPAYHIDPDDIPYFREKAARMADMEEFASKYAHAISDPDEVPLAPEAIRGTKATDPGPTTYVRKLHDLEDLEDDWDRDDWIDTLRGKQMGFYHAGIGEGDHVDHHNMGLTGSYDDYDTKIPVSYDHSVSSLPHYADAMRDKDADNQKFMRWQHEFGMSPYERHYLGTAPSGWPAMKRSNPLFPGAPGVPSDAERAHAAAETLRPWAESRGIGHWVDALQDRIGRLGKRAGGTESIFPFQMWHELGEKAPELPEQRTASLQKKSVAWDAASQHPDGCTTYQMRTLNPDDPVQAFATDHTGHGGRWRWWIERDGVPQEHGKARRPYWLDNDVLDAYDRVVNHPPQQREAAWWKAAV